jgi:predicted transcriptional regulator
MRNAAIKLDPFVRKLSDRRENLGISQNMLAKMTGVSLPTVQRLFTGNKNTSLDTVSKIANALGLSLGFSNAKREEEVIAERARMKAKQLAKMVQGTSALESQGLDKDALESIENKILHQLLKGSRSQLWSD